ncbi:MAG: hypothetical protein ACO1NM_03105 [Sphingobium phenoxybenzoativorans]
MILAALLLVQALSQSPPLNIFDERYSTETKKQYEAYTLCLAKEAYDRRQDAGSPEQHVEAAKAACQKEYALFVERVVEDSKDSPDATSAATDARFLLDRLDARVITSPPAPTKLAQLPVEKLIGDWRLGNGSLAVDMTIRFTEDGAMVGTLKSDFEEWAGGLSSWKVEGDGTRRAIFHASFVDKRRVSYNGIPSSPSEMNFINTTDPMVQRFDLVREDDDLLIRWVSSEGGGTLRFRRQMGTAPGAAND